MSEPNDPTQPEPNQPEQPAQPEQPTPPQQPEAQQPPVPPAQPQPPADQPPYAPPPAGGYSAAPQVNPYGGAPAYAGSKAYVQQNFGPVAGFGSRALALIIDSLIVMIGLIPMIIGVGLLVAGSPETDSYGYTVDGTANGGLMAFGGILLFLSVVFMIGIQIWNRIFRMGRTGQSIGKKVMGLKLINEQTGQPIGALQAFLREIVGGLVNQVFYLSYLWMLWDDNSQTLADKVVHSTVIEVPKG